jgi:hypothetical protein
MPRVRVGLSEAISEHPRSTDLDLHPIDAGLRDDLAPKPGEGA